MPSEDEEPFDSEDEEPFNRPTDSTAEERRIEDMHRRTLEGHAYNLRRGLNRHLEMLERQSNETDNASESSDDFLAEAGREFNNEILGGNGRGDNSVNREYSLPSNSLFRELLPTQYQVVGDRLLSRTAPIDRACNIDLLTGLHVIARTSERRQSGFEPSDPPPMRQDQEGANQAVEANAAVSGNGFVRYGAPSASDAPGFIHLGGMTSQGGEPAANTTQLNAFETTSLHADPFERFGWPSSGEGSDDDTVIIRDLSSPPGIPTESFRWRSAGEGADDGTFTIRFPSSPPPSIDTTYLPGQGARFCLRGHPESRVIYTSGNFYTNDVASENESGWGECSFAFGPDSQPSGLTDFRFRLEDRGPDGSSAVATQERAALRAIVAALGYRRWDYENASRLIIGTDLSHVIENAVSYHPIWMRNRESLSEYEDYDLWTLFFMELDEYYNRSGTSVHLWHTHLVVPNPARYLLPLFSEPFPDFVPYTG